MTRHFTEASCRRHLSAALASRNQPKPPAHNTAPNAAKPTARRARVMTKRRQAVISPRRPHGEIARIERRRSSSMKIGDRHCAERACLSDKHHFVKCWYGTGWHVRGRERVAGEMRAPNQTLRSNVLGDTAAAGGVDVCRSRARPGSWRLLLAASNLDKA